MRRGEVLGLKWSDIDLDQGMISIRHSLKKTNTEKQQFAEPKTPKSKRDIEIGASTINVLQQHWARQQSGMALSGDAYINNNLLFGREDGEQLYPDVLNGVMDRIIKNAKLPRTRIHDLRHTYATLQAEKGTPIKTLQDLLGHATSRMTLAVYTHGTAESMARATANM